MGDAPHIAILRAGLSRACRLRIDLERELSDIAQTTSLVPDDEHDAEGSTVGYERARVGALLSQCRHEIVDLTDALDRAATGSGVTADGERLSYGVCRRCGVAIDGERLAALPATATCVHCARGGPPTRFRLVS